MVLLLRVNLSPALVHILIILAVMVFGVYSSVRGLFIGSVFARFVAGVAMLFWIWVIYTVYAASSHAVVR